jgi:phosphoribosyl 1,2-cyclic phosphate phosphodiesterase
MRVFFLGTGAAEGFPALFCDCPICGEARKRGGRDKRTRTTVLVDDLIKIDLPPDTLAHVHAYPNVCLARLEHLLFTHSHDDHFAVRELQYLSPNFAPGRRAPLHLYASNDALRKVLPEFSGFFEKAPLRFKAVQPFEEFGAGHLRVTPITAHHKSDEMCFNYLLTDTDTGRTLLYGSDTGWWDPPTWEYLATRRVDAVILECGKGVSENGYDGHLNVDDCVQVKRKLEADGVIAKSGVPFYLTHIAHTGLLLHEEMARLVEPYGMSVAFDGLEITV